MRPLNRSPVYNFPTQENVSGYLTTEKDDKGYNISDYLPARRPRQSIRSMLPPFEVTLRTEQTNKDNSLYSEKIKTLESRIDQLLAHKDVKSVTQNTQTDVTSFQNPTRLGWGPRMQITLVPPTKKYQEMMCQTQEVKPQQPKGLPVAIPKLQLPAYQETTQRSQYLRKQSTSQMFQKLKLTERNKQNRNTQRDQRHLPIFKDESVELYPVRNHEVPQLVRIMLSTH